MLCAPVWGRIPMLHHRLQDILSPNPATVSESAPILAALAIMEERHISCLLAVDAKQRPLGIFTEQDAVQLLSKGSRLEALTMGAVMHRPVFTLPGMLDYRDAYRRMREKGYRHLAVIDAAGCLIGVVSEGDFMRHLGMEELVELKTVSSVMTPNPFTLNEAATLHDAIRLMAEHHFSCVLIIRDTAPIGVLTERDLVRLARQNLTPAHTLLSQVMHTPVLSIEADHPLQEAVHEMEHSGIRHLAVMKQGQLVGLVTRHDIVKSLQGRYIDYLHATIRQQCQEIERNQDQMLSAQQRLHGYSLMEQVSDAIFVADVETAAIVDVNTRACESLGYSREALLALSEFDISTTVSALSAWRALCDAIRAQGQLMLETTQRRCGGGILPVQVSARLVQSEGREYVVSIARDMSHIRALDAQLQLQVHALNAVANAIIITDTEPRILWANAAFSHLTGYALGEAIGHKPAELIKSGQQEPHYYRQLWKTILDKQVWRGELVNRRKDGTLYDEELTITPICIDGEAITHFIAVKQDISARKEVELELRRLAATDTLTGLANRRHFLDQMALALARCQRHDTPIALLMLDLDFFKQVNDQYGHATGDEVLRHVAGIMAASLRRIDLLGRLGGEEFAILLPDTDVEGATEFAERLRQETATHPASTPTGEIRITISIGVTPFLADDAHVDTILARADRALYRAKGNGRNRVEVEPAHA